MNRNIVKILLVLTGLWLIFGGKSEKPSAPPVSVDSEIDAQNLLPPAVVPSSVQTELKTLPSDVTSQAATPKALAENHSGLQPKSAADILENMTDYRDPDEGSNLVPYGDPSERTLGRYCGLYESASGELAKIELDRSTAHTYVVIQDEKGKFIKHGPDQDIDLKLFKGDAMSVVISLSEGRVIYLKFARGASRSLSGWILPWRGRVALVDCWSSYADGGHQGDKIWPARGAVTELFPPPLE